MKYLLIILLLSSCAKYSSETIIDNVKGKNNRFDVCTHVWLWGQEDIILTECEFDITYYQLDSVVKAQTNWGKESVKHFYYLDSLINTK